MSRSGQNKQPNYENTPEVMRYKVGSEQQLVIE